jgi:hypothetical protein
MKRDATPDTGSRTVDVAEKHEIRHPRALKDPPFRFGVLELEGVRVRQAEVERRMMLEQKDRAILWGPPQAVFKEGKTLVTKLAGMGRRAFVERVDRYQGRRIECAHRLNVSIAVVIGIGEDGAKGCPAVMISHQQDRGRMNLVKNSAKNLVGGAITRMNEVAGDDDERNVAVIAIDNVDDAGKASGRVEPIQLSAAGRQMYVAKNNELHWSQDRISRRRYGPRRCREKRDSEQESRRLPASGLMDTRRKLPSAPFPPRSTRQATPNAPRISDSESLSDASS